MLIYDTLFSPYSSHSSNIYLAKLMLSWARSRERYLGVFNTKFR
jgi:hypothetical protein